MKILLPTGRWEYMQLVSRTRVHWVVRDVDGNRYTATNPHRRTA